MSFQYHYMYQVRDAAGKIHSHWHSTQGRAEAKRIGGTCKRILVECVCVGDRVYYPD